MAHNEAALRERDRFFSSIETGSLLHQLIDLLPGVAFFAKDGKFRLMAASPSFLQRLGLNREEELIGKNDYELFPASLAECYRRDDQAVFSKGQPRLRIVELFLSPQGIPDWYITNKVPIRNRRGKVIGVMGITEAFMANEKQDLNLGPIGHAMEKIRTHYREHIHIPELARLAGMSSRTLNRRFTEIFGMGPRAFIIKTRVLAAHQELAHTKRSVNDIALDLGFCDQSSFTRHFKAHFGLAPLRLRKASQAHIEVVNPNEVGTRPPAGGG